MFHAALRGRDPFKIEIIWRESYGSGFRPATRHLSLMAW